MSRPEIVMQTPAAKKLEAEVQRKLAEYSYSTADDVVMAEYVVVMLANAKTPDQITAELSELIGEDMYDPGFTSWLFDEVARQYGVPSASSIAPPSPEPQDKLFRPNNFNQPTSHQDMGDKIQTVNDSRDHQANYRGTNKRSGHVTHSNRSANIVHPNRINPGGVFGQAVTGIKRSGPNDIIKDSPPHRRPRQDDYSSGAPPTGPRAIDRNPRDPYWSNSMIPDRREHPNGQRAPSNHFPFGQPMGAESAAKSILERVGVAINPNQQFRNTGFTGGYDHQSPPPFRRSKDTGLNGTSHSLPSTQQQMFYGPPSVYPPPLLPPNSFSRQHFNPHYPSNASTPQLFLANGQPYIPPHPFPIPGSTPETMYPYPVIQPPHSPRLSGAAKPFPVPQTKPDPDSINKNVTIAQPSEHEHEMDPLPSVPLLREECKYNLGCKNAWCPSSHCSPRGHPKTSMLLSFHACELQLKCTDPECLKAHVSPQQVDPKSSIKVMKTNHFKPTNPSPADASINRPLTIVTSINNKPISCRFGSQCTRSDCVFSHPWIVNDRMNSLAGATSTDKETGISTAAIQNSFSTIPCKFGLQCARPDCFYQHPNTRRLPSKNISKTFNNINTNNDRIAGQVETTSTSTVTGGSLTGLNVSEVLTPSKKFSANKPAGSTNSNGNGYSKLGGNELNETKSERADHLNKLENEGSRQDTTNADRTVNSVPNFSSNDPTTNLANHNNTNLNGTNSKDNNNTPVTPSTTLKSSAPIPAGV